MQVVGRAGPVGIDPDHLALDLDLTLHGRVRKLVVFGGAWELEAEVQVRTGLLGSRRAYEDPGGADVGDVGEQVVLFARVVDLEIDEHARRPALVRISSGWTADGAAVDIDIVLSSRLGSHASDVVIPPSRNGRQSRITVVIFTRSLASRMSLGAALMVMLRKFGAVPVKKPVHSSYLPNGWPALPATTVVRSMM